MICLLLPLFHIPQFSHLGCSVMSDSLQPHGLQHARLPCPSPPPGACSDLSPSSQWCHSTISSCLPLILLPSIFSSISVFSNASILHIRWQKYWNFSFSIRPSSEHSGLISFRMDCFDVLAVQGTLNSLLQHTVQKHRFFDPQISVNVYPASFCTPRQNFPVNPGISLLPNFSFLSPVMRRTSFWCYF